MSKKILATISIVPSMIIAIITWVISLPILLWQIPKDRYYRIAYGKTFIKVKYWKNADGTYTLSHNGKEKILTEEEFIKKVGADKVIK